MKSWSLPRNVRGNETVQVSVIVSATEPCVGQLFVTSNGETVDLDPDPETNGVRVALDAGKNRLSVTVRPPTPGPQLFEAVFEPEALIGPGGVPDPRLGTGDTVTENNRASGVTFVSGEGWVLLVAQLR